MSEDKLLKYGAVLLTKNTIGMEKKDRHVLKSSSNTIKKLLILLSGIFRQLLKMTNQNLIQMKLISLKLLQFAFQNLLRFCKTNFWFQFLNMLSKI